MKTKTTHSKTTFCSTISIIGNIHTVRKIRSAGEAFMSQPYPEITGWDYVKGGFSVYVDFTLVFNNEQEDAEHYERTVSEFSKYLTTYVNDFM